MKRPHRAGNQQNAGGRERDSPPRPFSCVTCAAAGWNRGARLTRDPRQQARLVVLIERVRGPHVVELTSEFSRLEDVALVRIPSIRWRSHVSAGPFLYAFLRRVR